MADEHEQEQGEMVMTFAEHVKAGTNSEKRD